MLVNKTVQVEKEMDDLMVQLVTVISELKAGQPISGVLLTELLQLQQMVTDIQALPADYAESFSGILKAIFCNAADLTAALMGKK